MDDNMEDPMALIEQWSNMMGINETDVLLSPNLTDIAMSNGTPSDGRVWYESSLGVFLAVPEWEAALTALILSMIIMVTLVGNVLVILSVFTYRPLRSAPNFFIVSLAVADMTVALLVLPLNVAYSILGRWFLGKIICEFWLTCDILCCTASILHLCAIALDRYKAITDPVNYARKRTLHRVLSTIAVVWIMSFLISSPPLLGWNDWPAEFNEDTVCSLTEEPGYVVYSALGSFFIPLFVMTAVYIRIFIATRRRLRQRAKASRLSAMQKNKTGEPGGRSGSGRAGRANRSSISSIEPNGNDAGPNDHLMGPRSNNSRNASFRSILGENGGQSLCRSRNGSTRSNAPPPASPIASNHDPQQQQQQQHQQYRNTNTLTTDNGPTTSSAATSSSSDSALRSSLKGRIQSQLATNDYDHSKLSPANVSDESITDAATAEGIPLNSNNAVPTPTTATTTSTILFLKNRNNNHSAAIAAATSNPNNRAAPVRPNKKQNRPQSQQISQFVEEKQRISLSKERKAARTLGIIMGVFVVCWLPFFLMYIILPFCKSCDRPSAKVVQFITWLGYVNSSLNPIIYTIFNLDFRKAFKKLLHIDNL